MSTELVCHRVFIASPGGLEHQRAVVRAVLNEFNEEEAFTSGVVFIPFGYESTPGSFGRPQDEINRILRTCDYSLILLADRWGTQPGGDNGYTSGTEEEYNEIVQSIEDHQLPMQDVLVAFKSVPRGQMADPGTELRKVLKFREGLEKEHALFYKTFDTDDELRKWVQQKLRGWARPPAEKGVGPASPSAAQQEPDHDDEVGSSADELVAKAWKLSSQGAVTQAEVLFSRAIQVGGPEVLLENARFMRRRGRLEAAFQLDREYIDRTAADDQAGVRINRSRALANMGVVRRKKGNLRESRAHLVEAVEIARLSGGDGEVALAYALDNLALTASQQEDVATSRVCFEEARSIRESKQDQAGIAQSLVNLARLDRFEGDNESAFDNLTEAIELLRPQDGQETLLANALVAAGETAVDLKRAEASDLVREGLTLNERVANSDGISIASAVLARIALSDGNIPEAERYAQRTAEESASSTNQEGLGVLAHLRGQIALARNESAAAVELLEEACTVFGSTGSTRRAGAAGADLAVARERQAQDSGSIST